MRMIKSKKMISLLLAIVLLVLPLATPSVFAGSLILGPAMVETDPDASTPDTSATEVTPSDGSASDTSATEVITPDGSASDTSTILVTSPGASGSDVPATEPPVLEGPVPDPGTNEMIPELSLYWVEYYHKSDMDPFDPTKLTVTPGNNATKNVYAYLVLSGVDAVAGDIEIRIPSAIFTDRDGNVADVSRDLGVGNVAGEGQTGFYWYLDSSADEIVVTNWRDIGEGNVLSMEFFYSYTPSTLRDGSSHEITASATVKNRDGNTYVVEADPLEITVNTRVKAGTLAKYGESTSSSNKNTNSYTTSYYYNGYYTTYQSGWGANAKALLQGNESDYNYVYWKIYYRADSSCTQPYTVTLSEPNANALECLFKGTSTGEYGTFLGFTSPAYAYDYTYAYRSTTFLTYPLTAGDDLSFTISTPSTSSTYYYLTYAVVAYPKALWDDLDYSDYLQFPNTVTARVEPADNDPLAPISSNGTYQYTYVAPTSNPYTDTFTVSKSQTNTLTTPTQKNSAYYQYGAIDYLEQETTDYLSLGFYSYTVSRNWSLTKDEGGNYGVKPYTTELKDERLYLGGTAAANKLTGGVDYDFDRIQLVWSQYTGDDTSPNVTADSNYTGYEPVQFYYLLAGESDYTWGGTLYRTGSSTYSYTSEDGGATSASGNIITLPENVVGAKAIHTGAIFRTDLYLYVSVRLYPSDRVIANIGNITNNGSISLYNYADAKVYADNTATGTALKTLSASNYYYLYRSGLYGARTKATSNLTNNATSSKSTLTYTITHYQYAANYSYWMTNDSMKGAVLAEQRNGTFYDLLPEGISAITDSISVKLYGTNIVLEKGTDYTVSYDYDWQGSGLTMMMITLHLREGYSNWYANSTYLYSGFVVTYNAEYYYSAMAVYGKENKVNSVAYRSNDGTLYGAQAASNSSLSYRALFTDLDGDGVADVNNNDTVFTYNTTTFTPVSATLTGLNKDVNTPEDTTYSKEAEVPVTGAYAYRLLYSNNNNEISSRIVLYDFLETGNGSAWKGSLVSVNTSYLTSLGIVPVVYYATDPLPANADIKNYKIENSTFWSTSPPADLNDVTAIAVDCSQSGSGNYVLQAGKMLYVTLSMRAPQDLTGGYAVNAPYVYAEVQSANDPFSRDMTSAEATRVSLRDADVSLAKSANPASGTINLPKVVSRGEDIAYTITLKNTNTATAITNVKIEDVIPDTLSFDADRIEYYFGSNSPALVSGATGVSVSQSGNTVTFHVNSLAPEQTVNFVVHTTVKTDLVSGAAIQNAATLVAFDNYQWEIESNTTYHRADTDYSVLANKILQNKTLTDNFFGFELFAKDINGDFTISVATGTNAADGTIKMGPVKYTEAGIYEYRLVETNSNLGGIVYDGTAYPVTVTVADNGSGSFTITQSSIPTFTNTYEYESTSFTLVGEKELHGRALTAGQFHFYVQNTAGDGQIVATVSNAEDGTILFTPIGIHRAGTYQYVVYEVVPNDLDPTLAYDKTVFTVTVVATDDGHGTLNITVNYPDSGIVFHNYYHNSVTLTKTGQDDIRLSGAEFDLYTEDGSLIGSYITAQNGQIQVDELPYGRYYFVETKAPDGYILDQTKHYVTISQDEAALTVQNKLKPNGGVILTKVDASDSNLTLAAAEFKLYIASADGSGDIQIGDVYTTDANGMIIVDDLPEGKYYFVETKAPHNYRLNATPIEFTMDADGSLVELTAANVKSSGGGGGGSKESPDPENPGTTDPEDPDGNNTDETIHDPETPVAPGPGPGEPETPWLPGEEIPIEDEIPPMTSVLPKTGTNALFAALAAGVGLCLAGILVGKKKKAAEDDLPV